MDHSVMAAKIAARPGSAEGPSAKAKSGFLGRVESARGLAALCVALTHTLGFLLLADHGGLALLDRSSARDAAIKVVDGLFNGETAVILFFVISGVVIGRSLDARRSDLGSFLIRRLFRLYPAHIVATVGIIGLAWLFLMDAPLLDFAAYPGMSPQDIAWLNGESFNPLKLRSVIGTLTMVGWSLNLVLWSLYAEVCAAPFLPLFHILARKGSRWLDIMILAALIGLSLINWHHLWSRYLFVFYLGMMVETRGLLLARSVERVLGGSWPALGLLYLLMVLPNTFAATRTPLVVLLEGLGAFGVVSVVVRSEGRPALASLDHPLLRWNGRLSYSFYLWHYFILTVTAHKLYASFPAEAMHQFEVPIFIVVSLVTVAIALAIAQLSYIWVELPSIALGHALVDRLRRISPKRPRATRAISVLPGSLDRDATATGLKSG
jgi:peptidoglycan/LPS O-acetylase OafA/YrhL